MLRKASIGMLSIYTAIICYLSLTPINVEQSFQLWDKAAHAIAYSGFAILCSLIATNKRQLVILFTLCFLFGISIEVL